MVWFHYFPTLPKLHRYTLGQRIDALLIESMEAVSLASYTPRQEKIPYVRLAIRKVDTIKVLLLILWETKSLDNNKYIALSNAIEEVGRMLGGWHNQVVKQNSPATRARET